MAATHPLFGAHQERVGIDTPIDMSIKRYGTVDTKCTRPTKVPSRITEPL